MAIDITDTMVRIARKVPMLHRDIYSYYPKKLRSSAASAVISCTGHEALLWDEGEEIIATLTYSVDVYAQSQSDARNAVDALTNLYATMHIVQSGQTLDFDPGYEAYHVAVSYRARVDKRGAVYTM